ncbi:MAG: DNA helicase RecQ [Desulfobacterales bacterium]|jgi:ATP-dependent DNA helicase RecQ|nr:DNA helicase RecQ [Desulfobacterales bacterium]
MASTLTPHDILRKFYGYRSFRAHQLEIIEGVLRGQDAFVLMPTGSGKSICYQIPAVLRPGIGVVISPLIALMQDQVFALRQNGLRADYLNSSLSADEARRTEKKALSGGVDLLYVAPERLLTDGFQRLLRQIPIALFAIDEAHCVSQWGHDFRPEYLQIADVTREFAGVPRIALTATADAYTRGDILEKLDLGQAARFVSSFDRPNIRYRVQLKANGKRQLLAFIRDEHPGESGIVYVRTRKRADETAAWLAEQGIDAAAYHAGLEQTMRMERQRRFLREPAAVMVATIAFGMGIDKPDVRFVAHLDLPASMEAYYQETGRAGRDGKPADAWMAYSLGDVTAVRMLQEGSEGSEAFKRLQGRKLEALLGFCETVECRRGTLLGYFGESYAAPCGNCDNCLQPAGTWDGSVAAQKALSCVYRTGQRFGAAHLTDILVGNASPSVLRHGHDRIKTFGVGRDLSAVEWRSVFRQLAASGLLTVNLAEISGFRLTDKSWPVLKGVQAVQLRKDEPPQKGPKPRPAGKTAALPDEAVDEGSRRLFERLRQLRLEISKELGVPPYVVFHDRTLKEMAVRRPSNRSELLGVTGVGERKAEQYGERFLDAIQSGS